MDIEIRPVTTDEHEAFARVADHVFANRFDAERFAQLRQGVDLDRTLAAFDPATVAPGIVATTVSFGVRLSVPGADLPAAGVSGVTVLPTHRRRGLLNALMRRQLDDTRDRGEPLAFLWASETPIYPRYGYGMASEGLRGEIATANAAFSPRVARPERRVRLIPATDVEATIAPVHERLRETTPGMLHRSSLWWARQLYDPKGETRTAVVDGPDGVEAYARYRVEGTWSPHGPDHTLTVTELVALGPAATIAMWRYLLDIDLVRTVKAWHRPVDEPLQWLLEDPRALQRAVTDGMWVRLVDLPTAMKSRRYALGARLVLEVADEFCPWNAGTWMLEAGPDGASCVRAPSGTAADLSLDAADLGAAYLGSPVLGGLVRSGRVGELRPGAGRQAALAFGWNPRPWADTFF